MNYQFNFSDLTDDYENVDIIHHHTGKKYSAKYRVEDKGLINTEAPEMSSIIADLIDLAASVYMADWLSPQNNADSQHIYIRLPLRNR